MEENREARRALALKNARQYPRKIGKAAYINFLEGKLLTRDEAIQATCYACNLGEDTGPCTSPTCALTQFCPWNRQKDDATSRQ